MSRVSTLEESVLIPALIPEFLEKPDVWFEEHVQKIRAAHDMPVSWSSHLLILATDERRPRSPLLRALDDLGYVKTHTVTQPGEFAVRGGIIDIFPIKSRLPRRIEFVGDVVSRISAYQLPPPPLRATKEMRSRATREHPFRLRLHLKPGDYVVHEDHGVGVFREMRARPAHEYFCIEYAPPKEGKRPDILLVPLAQAKKLTRYLSFAAPAVHRLGGSVWNTVKKKAQEDILKFAQSLLALYAEREISERPPYERDAALERELTDTFPFEETPDQQAAYEAIVYDMTRAKPMDRLLCADVGFGKTEITLRAAAIAAANGCQAALLAPTTILAEQHYDTFASRFAALPLRVGILSRFQSAAAQRTTIHALAQGKIDVVIGTHRLLSRDIHFKNLGLLIIDEEQRFGVRQKERLRASRAHLDVLSLSATPIPRTLYLALSTLREITVMHTPPPGRRPIQTFVYPRSRAIVREAIAKELARNGQVFYLSNRIGAMRFEIERLHETLRGVRGARIGAVHGKMPEHMLARTMREFRNGHLNILVATTIIESGLDMPRVNTLVVSDATRLGLAESHQLRGRIGRSTVQAYAYFLYPARSLKGNARERLRALQEATYLGAGYELALRDLEIRGAGNILGKEQSGSVNKVGLNLYCAMLAEAVETLRHASAVKTASASDIVAQREP